MTNPIIETDLKDILKSIDSKLEKIDDRLSSIETTQARLEEKINAQDKTVTSLSDSSSKQIWALIALISAIVVGLGKLIFFPSP